MLTPLVFRTLIKPKQMFNFRTSDIMTLGSSFDVDLTHNSGYLFFITLIRCKVHNNYVALCIFDRIQYFILCNLGEPLNNFLLNIFSQVMRFVRIFYRLSYMLI